MCSVVMTLKLDIKIKKSCNFLWCSPKR